jgi:tRNA(Arg) A34 adenosine deaminase TadA
MNYPVPEALAQQASEYLASRLALIEPQTAEEFFAVLLDRAVRATKSGDYGISAALAVRCDDVELIIFGQNTMISARDPFGHAEANAIRCFERFMTLSAARRTGLAAQWHDPYSAVASGAGTEVFVRPVPPSPKPVPASPKTESLLYATLEPCPMCTVAIMNSRIQHVIIASPDEPGGALAPQRLARLPEVWPQIAASQGLQVTFTNSQLPADTAAYIPPELSAMLEKVFWDTKAERDAEVAGGVLFAPDLQRSMRDILKSARQPD